LAARSWPPEVSIEDISYNPIAVVQRLQDEPEERRFDVAIVAGALQRQGRNRGTLSVYRWDNQLPGQAEIQDAVAEAVTGIISLDNTLVVARHFGALPDTVVVIEIEPDAHEFGDDLTPAVAGALAEAESLVASLAREPWKAMEVGEGPLSGERSRHSGVVWTRLTGDVRVQ
jgi:Ni,Fe-hydrogenase maturation factor